MNPRGWSLLLPQSEIGESESTTLALLPRRGIRERIAGEIADFLDGKTHGEGLLHALYDHILDEPIPERLRQLFKKATAAGGY